MTMNKTVIAAVLAAGAAFAAATAVAEPKMPAPGEKVKVHHMTPEMREKIKQRHGERIVKPGSQKGKVAFIDTREQPSEALKKLVAAHAQLTQLNLVFETAAPGEAAALKAASKADIAVVLVDDEKTPAMLAAIEDGWAVVNARQLARSLATEEAKAKFFDDRCAKEALRAFAAISGGLGSQYQGNLMGITKIEDLDLVQPFLPMDKVQAIGAYLAAHGVTPLVTAHYRQACKQGWAPAPTNDYQKAIWDDVHAIPTEPLKIKYQKPDQATDTGK